MNTPPPLLGLVLAGGRSRRMGRDKAAMTLGGQTWLERTVGMLTGVGLDVRVSIRADQKDEPVRRQFDCLPDPPGGLGPIGAIHGALLGHPDRALLVLACDLPAIVPADLNALIRARDTDADATAMRSSTGSIHPLFAIWEPRCAEALAAAINQGERSPRRFLESARLCVVELPDPERLDGVNEPWQL